MLTTISHIQKKGCIELVAKLILDILKENAYIDYNDLYTTLANRFGEHIKIVFPYSISLLYINRRICCVPKSNLIILLPDKE